MRDETKCLHSGYKPGNAEPRVLPIVQSITYAYDTAEEIAKVFDDPTLSLVYSRFGNPTVMAVEEKIADLEGGVAAMCTSSGQAATLLSVLNICGAGDHIVSLGAIYGGTTNLFNVTLKRLGIDVTFVNGDDPDDVLEAAFTERTRLVFGETIANPALKVLDIRRFADLAHRHGVPLIVDNTFATPVFCKPFEFGADIVVHSTSKYLDGHAVQIGGVIVDGGTFDWTNGKFPELTEPDASYHGISYTGTYGKAAYIIRARMNLMRDFGVYPAAHSAFLLNLGIETLPVRMRQYHENGRRVAEYLLSRSEVAAVRWPGLPGDSEYPLYRKYLKGCGAVISLTLKGGRAKAMAFLDALKLVSNEVHVADIRTCILHPASSTHRQCTDEQLAAAGIDEGLVRLSVGLENVDDIIADLDQAFAAIG
ncbi:MAG: O-acetylhomoserine aminocarboxypropyltransferase/cysteine synthase [Clostridia bacterium]|nr:O-acetylhomoserine aminocarboxypropyltransferase/cysteine synthase [Clostridia bacterium]